MNRAMLLTTVSIIAVSAVVTPFVLSDLAWGHSHPFQPIRVLYNQNSNDSGTFVNSQNFSSTTYYDDQGADDFVVPQGRTWKVKEVDVTGVYFNGSGSANSVNVIFYKNDHGAPGAPLKNGTFNNLNAATGPNFLLQLPGTGVKLRAGRYWVSVVANSDWPSEPTWGWEVNSVQHGHEAMWRNPGGGLNPYCENWGMVENCVSTGPDYMFVLRGHSR